MTDYNLKLDIVPTDKYEKAKKDLVTALNSLYELSQDQKEKLVCELVGEKTFQMVYELAKLMYNRK